MIEYGIKQPNEIGENADLKLRWIIAIISFGLFKMDKTIKNIQKLHGNLHIQTLSNGSD